jgi:hypothetical protein
MMKNLFNYMHCGIRSKVLMLTGILWLSAFSLFAQQTKTVTGVVYDASNATLPGATILVKGTTLGTTSDLEGKFTLQVPATATTLVISFIGMVSQELAITTEPMKVTLLSAATDLDQVVVVG